MDEIIKESLGKYLDLMRSYVSSQMSVSLFEQEYLKMFKNEKFLFNEPIYTILNEIFGDVDAYCADSTIRNDDDIDEEELLKRATTALIKLEEL